MSKADIWMPLFIGDYMADTMHLDATAHGVYLMLIMHYWRTGPLTDNQEILKRISRCDDHAWSNAWSIVQAFFKHEDNGTYTHTRIDAELLRASSQKSSAIEKARAAAAARWKVDATSNAPRIATSNATSNATSIGQAMLEECPLPLPLPLEIQKKNILDDFPKKQKISNDISADFEIAWGKYPARAGGNSKQKALKAWLARLAEGVSPAALLAGVDRYAEFVRATDKLNTEYVKQAATFFGPDKHYAEEWRPPAKILKPNFEGHHSKPSHKEFPQ